MLTTANNWKASAANNWKASAANNWKARGAHNCWQLQTTESVVLRTTERLVLLTTERLVLLTTANNWEQESSERWHIPPAAVCQVTTSKYAILYEKETLKIKIYKIPKYQKAPLQYEPGRHAKFRREIFNWFWVTLRKRTPPFLNLSQTCCHGNVKNKNVKNPKIAKGTTSVCDW